MKFLSLAIIMTIFSPKLVYAHDINNSLNPSAYATDYYQIHCFDNLDGTGPISYLEVTLQSAKAAPVVSIQVQTAPNSVPFTITNLTAPNTGGKSQSRIIQIANNSATPYTHVDSQNNANGYYYIAVNKTKLGKQTYHITYHCMGISDHGGTDEATVVQKDFPK